MNNQNSRGWSRLDNIAKAFPPTVIKADTRVFRFSCELADTVDAEILQRALERVTKDYPHFLVVIRMGIFWYYFEQCDIKPKVFEENKAPCGPIYIRGQKNLLFEVSYYKKRINLEVFHGITDGTGAMQFLKAIVISYINERYAEALGGAEIPNICTASADELASDDFRKYYKKPSGEKNEKPEKIKRVFTLKGEMRPNDDILVTEGIVSVAKMLELARANSTTLTGFLTALYIHAVVKTMNASQLSQPVVMGIPVNLRNFFPSETSRNFFGIVSFKYIPDRHSGEIKEICEVVSNGIKNGLNKEDLHAQLNENGAIERNIFAQLAPLPVKNFAIRFARRISDKSTTGMVSNAGQVKMPPEAEPFIKLFSFFTATMTQQVCACSYGDFLSIGFTSAFISTEIQKNFFRALTGMGVEVRLNSSDYDS